MSAYRLPDLNSPYRPRLDMERVRRALTYLVEDLGDGAYRILGDASEYYVRLTPFFDCECGDFSWRGQRSETPPGPRPDAVGEERPPVICKHLIAALLFAGDAEARECAETVRAELEQAAIAEALRPAFVHGSSIVGAR